jgi:hypothetical protein
MLPIAGHAIASSEEYVNCPHADSASFITTNPAPNAASIVGCIVYPQ